MAVKGAVTEVWNLKEAVRDPRVNIIMEACDTSPLHDPKGREL